MRAARNCLAGLTVLFTISALGLGLAVSQQITGTPSDTLGYKTVPAKKGEHCLICGMELTDNDIVLIYRGRRVPLKRAMVEQFVRDPGRYFFKLEPRSVLFDENAVVRSALQRGWLIVGSLVVTSLLFAGLTAQKAVRKGLAPAPWFFVGLAGNAFGFLAILFVKPVPGAMAPAGWAKAPVTTEPTHCPTCGAEIHPSARKCPFCGKDVLPEIASEVERVGLRGRTDSPRS